ncbi:hypothetical protein [Marinicrinis sediminis]|uniref:Peptidase S1 domain-containing protein n=1 Tax=Marinicrinis sediminis TaxID=1652465 RepID=A0ABW5REQ1_9BACL
MKKSISICMIGLFTLITLLSVTEEPTKAVDKVKGNIVNDAKEKRKEFGFPEDEEKVEKLISEDEFSEMFGFYLTSEEEMALKERIIEQDIVFKKIKFLIDSTYYLKNQHLGMYINQYEGGDIYIGFKSGKMSIQQIVNTVNASIQSFIPIHVYEAEYSESEMNQYMNILNQSIYDLQQSIPSMEYLNLDFINQKIKVGVTNSSDVKQETVQQLSKITNADSKIFEIVYDPYSSEQDHNRNAKYRPMKGGIVIDDDTNQTTLGECTLGYSAIDPSTNEGYIITASHCWFESPGTGIFQGEGYVGHISSKEHYGNNVDAKGIRVTSTDLLSNDVYSESVGLTVPQVPGNDVLGEMVCMSGRNRGANNSCGTLQGKNNSRFWTNKNGEEVWFNSIRLATYESTNGDSGGTVFYDETLKGINKGRVTEDGVTYGTYSHVGNVTNRLGLNPVTW